MRRNIRDIQEPPYIDDETKCCGCLTWVDETLTYFINRHNRQYLLWSFWYSFAEYSYYEDPHLENDFFKALTTLQNWVPYCETIIIKRSDISSRAQNYPKGYRISSDRLDFYVTKREFLRAFFAVKALGRATRTPHRASETFIFGGHLHVVLLPDTSFGEKGMAYKTPAS